MNTLGYRLPDDFLIGTAHAAFQCEGAWDRDGKTDSIMDHYAREYAGKPAPEAKPEEAYTRKVAKPPLTADVPDRGCFFYDNYEEYIEDMQKTGQNTYRMSIAWPRIIPTGVGAVNPKGIEFYNKVIDKLIACGITPFVDLCHWDLPQCLQEKGGFESPDFPEWFEAYAGVCFENFGDRVKMWSTFNELFISIISGHCNGRFPPFIADNKRGQLAGHHCLIAHFRAVRLYKSMNLGGKIGAVNCTADVTPAEPCEEDIGAAELQFERQFDWFVKPMLEGVYPQKILRECPYVRDAMPEHYQEDLDKWFVPMDFIGINYYISVRTAFNPEKPLRSNRAESFYSAPGQSYAPYPAGLFDVVQQIADRYPGLELYITENGCALPNIHDEEKECDDDERVTYIREHMRMCARLIRAGYNLKGYYYWCDADSYEELTGYALRFGLTWVDHETGKRRWKKSRYYFSKICKSHLVN